MIDNELSQLKALSLEAYAIGLGYIRDSEKSSARVSVLRRDSEKLLVTVGQDGHWIYRNERNHADHGSILDFVMNQHGVNLGEARKELRAWANFPFHPAQESPKTAKYRSVPTGTETGTDRNRIQAGWDKSAWNPEPDYLLSRSIPASTLNDPRFRDCWRMSRRGAVLFPHRDQSGLCGLEIRGDNLKVFSKGGKKGLWISANIKSCKRLVITESPIDALSFHALHTDATDAIWALGYASFGGGMGNRQKSLLELLVRRMTHRGVEIIAGVDNDPAGDEYAETLAALAPLSIARILPVSDDFNADLQWCVREVGTWN